MGDQYMPELPLGVYEKSSVKWQVENAGVWARRNSVGTSSAHQLLHSPALRAFAVNNPILRPSGMPLSTMKKLVSYPRGTHDTLSWQKLLMQPQQEREQLERKRSTLLFCSCVNEYRHWGRAAKVQSLHRNGFNCKSSCSWGEGQAHLLRSKFVFSPRGNSAQNFRDWEALLAGAIPR
mmetsp:Transcript_18724/g.38028  ORF Transcript_18724/g.38028 Transcript_18724/m.38028 type:complete len:178 (-) Transcript_18724:248-781(-)